MPDLAQRVADLERKTRGIPSRWAGAAAPLATLIRIGRGNKLAEYGTGPTKIYGLKYTTTSIASILAAELTGTAPDVTGTDEAYTAGLCWGYLEDGTAVFVSNKATPSGGAATQDILSPLNVPEGAQVWGRRTLLVPAAADPLILIPVWLTWRV